MKKTVHLCRSARAVITGVLLMTGAATAQPITPVDIVGHLPLFEYNTYISPAGRNNWGGEPHIAVNPVDPNKMVVTTFSGFNTPGASLWYSQDGGSTWGLRRPISSIGSGGPNDQTIAYDPQGTLHYAMLDFSVNVYHGQTVDPNLDGRDGRPASVWQWTNGGSRVNLQALNAADQPWIALGPTIGNPGSTSVHIGYDHFSGSSVAMRATRSTNNGATFTVDQNISNGFLTPVNANPGLRLTTDRQGRAYSIFGWGDAVLPNNDKHVRYFINRDSGGAGWDFTASTPQGGLVVDDGNAHIAPGNKFGNVNALLGNTTSIAVSPNGDHVYAIYGKQPTGSLIDQLWCKEFHPDPGNPNNLISTTAPVMLSTGLLQSEIPNAAVTDDGKLWVQYDQYSPSNNTFSVHLASSTNNGASFGDQTLYSFVPPIVDNGDPRQRIIGDYQGLVAVGNEVCGTFCARGNVNAGGINTTNWMVPFAYCVPTPGAAGVLALAGVAALRRRRRSA
jgi:hypothetical protein